MSQPVAVDLTLADFAEHARRSLDPGVWDFLEGGAGEEQTLAANREAFDRARLQPRVLTGTSQAVIGTRILGRPWAAPIGVAPMAYHTLADPEGEVATARACAAAGLPLVVSTFAGRTFEDVAAATTAPLWLQVYCFRDRGVTRELIDRARDAGFEALVLTVDAPHLGRRLRDVRTGFRLPPGITPANLPGADFSSPQGHARTAFDAELDWSVVEWLKSVSSLPVLLKGVLTAADARLAVAAGADGLVVSNHGGRQLDGVVATAEALPQVVDEVAGACPVLVDGGVRRGRDVLAALALGADAVLLGRPVLHGLAVDQERGVRAVLDILVSELADAMILTGTGSVARVAPELVRPAVPRAASAGGCLRKEELHSSVSDPLLDTMNFLNEVTHRYPEAISFAPGRPYEGFFDVEQLFTHLRQYLDHLERTGSSAEEVRRAVFQYGATGGQIRELIADSLRKDEGIDVPAESIVVTVGAQEAMLLAVRALISGPDDVLLVSSPCYVGITGAARLLDVRVRAVSERDDGFRCADLEVAIEAERAAGRRPRAFYLVPDHSNPSGATVSRAARHELLDLAARHDLLLLEDSPYRLVSSGRQLPTLKALDRERRVVHLGSFSKTLFPGARVGFAVADQIVVDRQGATGFLADELSKIKSMVTVNTSALSQAVVAGMLLSVQGHASRLNTATAAYYADAMLTVVRELDRCFPAADREALGVRWNEPTGGFFLSVTLPFRADDAALVRSAENYGVVWTPMSYFYPEGGGEHSLRLSVSCLTQADIVEGVARLARFVRAEAGRARAVTARPA
jgi:(S)-3,5-dihydroxyphenylglycine transaminase